MKTVDFAEIVNVDDFYCPTAISVMSNAIDVFQIFAETTLEQFQEGVRCTVVSFDWVVHDVGLVKLDFTCSAMFHCDTITLRRSKLPFKKIGGWRAVLFDESTVRKTLTTMLKFEGVCNS